MSEDIDVDSMLNVLQQESKKCYSITDYVNLVFDFIYHDHMIKPLQQKDEIKLLLEILNELKPKIILEIGTAGGGTLFLLCKIADPNATIISVDLPEGKFGGELYPDWKKNLYQSFNTPEQKLHLIRSDSHSSETFKKILKILGTRKIDFILIDGDHTYKGVEKDFEMYKELISDHGIIAFHDINPSSKENVGEVPEFWNMIKSRYETLEIIYNKNGKSPGLGLLFLYDERNSITYISILKKLLNWKEAQSIKTKSEFETNPIGILLSIYADRSDLQHNMPSVKNGEIRVLIDWAIQICENKIQTEEITRQRLLRFLPWYHKYKDNNDKITYDLENLQSMLDKSRHSEIILQNEIMDLKNKIQKSEIHVKLLSDEIQNLTNELVGIKTSVGYKIIRFYGSIIDKLFKNKSALNIVKEDLIASKKVIQTEGPNSFITHVKTKIKRKEFHIVSPQLYDIPTNKVYHNQKLMPVKHLFSEDSVHTAPSSKFNVVTMSYTRDNEILMNKLNTQLGVNLRVSQISSISGDIVFYIDKNCIPLTDHLIYDCCKVLSDEPQIGIITAREIPGSGSDMIHAYDLKRKYDNISNRMTFDKNYSIIDLEEKEIMQIASSYFCYNNEFFVKYKINQHMTPLDMLAKISNNCHKIILLNSTGIIHHKVKPASYYLIEEFNLTTIFSACFVNDDQVIESSSLSELLNHIAALYSSLCMVIDKLNKNKTEDINEFFDMLYDNLFDVNNLGTRLYSDESLDNLFLKFPKTNMDKIDEANYILQQYADSLKDFKNFLKETYPNLKNIINELTDSLFKIFAKIVGKNLGKFVLYSEKKNLNNYEIISIKEILKCDLS